MFNQIERLMLKLILLCGQRVMLNYPKQTNQIGGKSPASSTCLVHVPRPRSLSPACGVLWPGLFFR